MNDPNYTTRDQKRNRRISNSQQQQQQPSSRSDGRRRVATTATGTGTTKSDRPRSGSWGAQELHYYMNNNNALVDYNGEGAVDVLRLQQQQQGKPKSRFLSKLKMQRAAAVAANTAPASEYLSASSSVMTLASSNNVNVVPPSESLSGNNKQKRRPPLPLEMVHPDQTAARSTPHPSLARYDQEKSLPVVIEAPLFAMTPATNSNNNITTTTTSSSASKLAVNSSSSSSNNKKRTTAIRSIGRFFRALGKNQSLEQQQSSTASNTTAVADDTSAADNNNVDKQLDQHLSPILINTTTTTTTPVLSKRSKSIDTIPGILEASPKEIELKSKHESVVVHRQLQRKYSTLNCIESKQQQRPTLRRSLSLDDIQRRRDDDNNNNGNNNTETATTTPPSGIDEEALHTIQRKKPLILSRSNSSSYYSRCRQRRRRRHHRTNTTATTTDDEDYDGTNDLFTDTEDGTLIDQRAAQESQIAGDRLSKRLSGGHFGSAGGLILSTLPVPSRHQTDDEYEEEEEEEEEDDDEEGNARRPAAEAATSSGIMSSNNYVSGPSSSSNSNSMPTAPPSECGSSQHHPNVASTVHTETSESDTIVTPPNDDHPISHRRRDSIYPVDPYDHNNNGQDEKDDDDQEEFNRLAADTAKRIWEEDPTVYADMEHIAEWIGNGKPLSMNILQHYFLYFDFSNMRLDDAFRKLCGKLHMKAETQQIDRILVEFANRYWDCNPSCIFGNSDVVHAVVYSLLLLNTDLHVAQGDHKKMSRSAFVRNTMNAARAQYERTVVSEDNDDNMPLREEHRSSNVTFHSLDSRSHSYDLKRTNSCKSSASSGSLGRFYSTAASSLDMTPAAMVHGNHPTGSKGWQSEVEAILREMYVSIRNRQIRHPASKDDMDRDETSTRHSRRRSLQITGSRVGAFKRSVGTIMWKAARESMVVSEHAELDRFYGTNAAAPTSPRSTTSVHSTSFPRRRSMTSLKSSFSQSSHLTQSNSITTYQAVAPLLHHSELPTSYTSAAPYYKEGLLVRKHLLERAGQKAKHRDWKECFLVVDRGEIRMYKLDSNGGGGGGGSSSFSEHRKSMARSSIMISRVNLADALANNPSAAVGGGDWLANAEAIGEIDLKHTLSNALPSGYSRQRPHAFALQQPNGGVFLFQVGSADQVVEWVSTCNYWAARESKEPLMGGVSNMEYGWGSCLDCVSLDEENEQETVSWQQNTFPAVTIHEWQPPVPPSVGSAMEEAAQLNVLHKHVSKLNEELDKHRDVKRRMELRFSARSTAGARAMGNWENKSQYLLHEIIKYQNYCDAIEKSLTLQARALEEERKKKNNNSSSSSKTVQEPVADDVIPEGRESIAEEVAVTTNG